jgi:pimeloyl-ACP methyl ester carboxylesterase
MENPPTASDDARRECSGRSTSKAIKLLLGLVLVVLIAAITVGTVLGLRSSRNKRAAAQTASVGTSDETGAPSLSPIVSATGLAIETDSENIAEDASMNQPTNDDATLIDLSQVEYNDGNILAYYHCGPSLDSVTTELVFLHGSVGSKEDWNNKTGILDDLCDGTLSVTALDFPPERGGTVLISAFNALVQSGVLSGGSVVVVTPSASGASVVLLAENHPDSLGDIIKAWIPIASSAVLSASDSTLQVFPTYNIPVLAITGDEDGMGVRVTEKLVNEIDAKGVELQGGHRVYMVSPDEFVQEILAFIQEENL